GDHVAHLHPRLRRGAARRHLADFCRGKRLAVGHEQERQHDDREDEIRDRTARDDRGPLTQPLEVERRLALRLRQLVHAHKREAGTRVAVAEHLDVAAQRNGAELPPRPGAVVPAEQLGSKADRKNLDPDPVASGNHVVPQLVHKHENRQDHEERDHGKQEVVGPAVQERFHHSLYFVSFRLRPVNARPRAATMPAAISRAWRSISYTSSSESILPPGSAVSVSSTVAAISRNPIRSSMNAYTAVSFAAFSTVAAHPPEIRAARASRNPGKRVSSGGSKVSRPIAARSSPFAGYAVRSGQPSTYEIGVRMSGEPICAKTEPSL